MTEKRFEICGEGSTNVDVTTYIVEYGDGDDDCFELYESKEDSQKVCDKLNHILDENEQLKTQLSQLAKSNREGVEKVQSLAKENEQLKQIAEEFAENPTQHNLWKLRNTLKELKGDVE